MEEVKVTLSESRYKELIEIETKIYHALQEGRMIVHHDSSSYFFGSGKFGIINETVLVNNLNNDFERLKKRMEEMNADKNEAWGEVSKCREARSKDKKKYFISLAIFIVISVILNILVK